MTKVYLYSCPCNMPVSFARHHWFVIDREGKKSRWEVLFRNDHHPTHWGHLYKDAFEPTLGVEVPPWVSRWHWKSTERGVIEGPVAEKMAEFIEASPSAYPFKEKYRLLGPNSNTYIQWILNSFPEFPAKLSSNSIGKGFRKR